MDYEAALTLSIRVMAVGVAFSSIEMATGRYATIWRSQPAYFGRRVPGGLTAALVAGRLLAAVTACAAPSPGLLTIAVALVAGCSLALGVLCPFGGSAADQMTTISYVAFTIWRFAPSTTTGVAWFLATTVVLIYVTTALVKVTSPTWGNGEALARVLASDVFGCPPLYRITADRPHARAAAEASLIVLQLAFVLVLADIGGPLAYAVCLGGLAFHAANAAILGLYDFPWIFVGLYPVLLAV